MQMNSYQKQQVDVTKPHLESQHTPFTGEPEPDPVHLMSRWSNSRPRSVDPSAWPAVMLMNLIRVSHVLRMYYICGMRLLPAVAAEAEAAEAAQMKSGKRRPAGNVNTQQLQVQGEAQPRDSRLIARSYHFPSISHIIHIYNVFDHRRYLKEKNTNLHHPLL